jgi:hypothetical protein
MNRVDAMLDRLPPVWAIAPGTLTHALLALAGAHLAAADQDADRIQRSHWVDHAFDLEDLAKLGALVGVTPAPWEPAGLFRVRLRATVAARLQGAVTRAALDGAVARILEAAQPALGLRHANLTPGADGMVFRTRPRPGMPGFTEFPQHLRRVATRLKPLAKLTLTNRGLVPAPLSVTLRGVGQRRSAVPVVANLTTGEIAVFRGLVNCGMTLRLVPSAEGALGVRLEGRDATRRVSTGQGFRAGEKFTPAIPDPAPRALTLARGDNTLWLFPLGLFSAPGLGTAVYAMPRAEIAHGVFAARDGSVPGTPFGTSLFEQPPFVAAEFAWTEQRPAAFRFDIPAGCTRCDIDAAKDLQEALFQLLDRTVGTLRAAGVDGRAAPAPFRETQRSASRGRAWNPRLPRTTQRSTARLAGLGALFDTTARDGARFQ